MKALFCIMIAAVMTGCLPLKYHGTFISEDGEIKVKLKGRSAVIALKGREAKKFNYLDSVLYAKADPDYIDSKNEKQMLALQNGEETVFLRELSRVDAEVTYIIPNKKSLIKLGQHSWFDAEVYRIFLDLSNPKDKTIIKTFYCTNGKAQIIRDSSYDAYFVNFGCPADAKYKPLKRQLPKGI